VDMQPSDAAKAASGPPKRYILVVTAGSDDLFRISMQLQRFAYQVCTAQTAGQALNFITVALPALVITDLVLPDMSGLDMLRKVKGDVRTLPIILLLPDEDTHVEKRSIEIGGGVPCLTKPVQTEELYRMVQALLEATPRSYLRIPTTLPVTVNKVLLDAALGEQVMNISENGLFVRMQKPPRRNEQVTVELNLNNDPIKAEAIVMHSRRAGEGPFREPGMAVRFTEIAPECREAIRKFIHDEVTRGIVAESE
jgi:CheY-like chemotaxis protein